VPVATSERVKRALQAAADLSKDEREELVTELILGLERDMPPEPGHEQAWAAEIRRRVDDVLAGRSHGQPWSQVRREIEADLARRRRAT
jgi:putative addiction module component (TIGR02574 family)